jgi:hypothetical protein
MEAVQFIRTVVTGNAQQRSLLSNALKIGGYSVEPGQNRHFVLPLLYARVNDRIVVPPKSLPCPGLELNRWTVS